MPTSKFDICTEKIIVFIFIINIMIVNNFIIIFPKLFYSEILC